MFKSVAFAAVAATGASALDFTQMLMLDQLSHGQNTAYGETGHSDILPLLALSDLTNTVSPFSSLSLDEAGLTNLLMLNAARGTSSRRHRVLPFLAARDGALAGGDLENMLLLDHLTDSHAGRGSKELLPMAVLAGADTGLPASDLTNLWALNQFGEGSSEDFEDLLTLATLGGVAGADLTSMWGAQRLLNGQHGLTTLMAATGRALPTSVRELALLNKIDEKLDNRDRHYRADAETFVRDEFVPRTKAFTSYHLNKVGDFVGETVHTAGDLVERGADLVATPFRRMRDHSLRGHIRASRADHKARKHIYKH